MMLNYCSVPATRSQRWCTSVRFATEVLSFPVSVSGIRALIAFLWLPSRTIRKPTVAYKLIQYRKNPKREP